MPSVLICAPDPLTDELRGTLIGRDDVERRLANRFQEALVMAVSARPDLVVVDSVFSQADRLVEDLRLEASTASVSIVVIARDGDHAPEGRYAGADAVLRPPAGPEWDERLSPLLLIPTRRAPRLSVELPFTARDEHRTIEGTVLNVSETGVLVETDAAPSLQTEIAFEITLRDQSEPVHGRGQVVRHDGPHRSGLKFATLIADGLARVRRLILSGNGYS
jgi:DNA-binding response OmpR family regulator